jgi:hypothetical protein
MKKRPPWLFCGIGALLLLGLVAILLGSIMPGDWRPMGNGANAPKSSIGDLRKKSDLVSNQIKEILDRPSFPGTNALSHRVFVSRTLLFLPGDKESVQPLNEGLVTSDGINVGWKIRNGFDLEDPYVADRDDDSDGFNNKEEFEKGTNPNDSTSSPSKWVKVKIEAVETNSLGISLSGKSTDRYTLRFQLSGKKKDVDVVIGDRLWLMATAKGIEISKNEADVSKVKESSACPHAIPIVVKEYHEDKGERMDEKTKTKNDYDDSFVELERKDGLTGISRIMIDERGKSRGVSWLVGDIRLISLVPGEGGMGPFRVGQSFSYAGKEFVIRGAATNKVSLSMKPEGEEVDILPKTP